MTNPYIWLFVQISFGVICAFIAQKKARSPYIWFLGGLFFSFLALIALFILPPVEIEKKEDDNMGLVENLKEIQELESVEDDAEQVPSESSNTLWYYLDENNQQLGPMTLQRLVNDWNDKKLKENTLVWNEEMSGWKPLRETSDFKFFR